MTALVVTALIVIVTIGMYFGIGGLSYSLIQKYSRPFCKHAPRNCDSECGHSWMAGISTVAWPVVLPMCIGIFAGGREKKVRLSRTERRRQDEIEEAKHRAELARYCRMENEELDRQLRSVKVSGDNASGGHSRRY